MRLSWFALCCLLLAGLVAGCVEDPAEDRGADSGPDRGLLEDGGADGSADAGDGAPDGERPRDAAPADAARDQGPRPDAFTGTEVESCEDACGRYADCGRLAEVFGDEAACLARCERISRDGPPESWFACLEVETCNLLHLCRAPDIDPLSCAEVCERAGTCELGLPFDCAAECEARGAPFRTCGESLLACNGAAFVECLGRDVYPACATTCEKAVGCNILRADGCVADCVGGLLDPDPLAALRARERNECVGRAGNDCEQINTCIFPPVPGQEPPVDRATLCMLANACAFPFECNELYQILLDEGGPAAVACAARELRNGCPPDPFLVFEQCLFGGGPDPRAQTCGQLCTARDVCGLLDGPRAACTQECIGFQGDPDELERYSAQLVCAAAGRCDELVACLASTGPAVECRDHCAALAGCGLAEDGCEAACDAAWPRDRHAAWRACVAAAGDDCAAVAACDLAPGVPCDAVCGRLADCGSFDPGCLAGCDDEHFARPTEVARVVACALTAPVCDAFQFGEHAVYSCFEAPAQHGLACWGFCRAELECRGAEGDLAECLRDCGVGLAGDDGLRFTAAEGCLAGLAIDAACPALTACVPAEIQADCPAFCARAEACGVDLTDCEANCAEDPLSRLRVLESARCLADAGDDCGAVRTCLVPPVPIIEEPAIVDRGTFCAAWNRCDFEDFFGFPCDEAYEFAQQEGPQVAQCVIDLLAGGCPPDPFFVLDRCFQGGGGRVNPLREPCADLCRSQDFCGQLAEADRRACATACAAVYDPNDPDGVRRLSPRLACGDAWSCEDLGACVGASTPAGICGRHCDTLAACGEVDDPQICVADCDADFARSRQFAWRACLDQAGDDCAAAAACEVAPGLPCDRYCRRLAECGAGDARCEAICDDAHFADPGAQALRVACVLAADQCQAAPGRTSVAECAVNPEAGAGRCVGFCRARTECVEDAAETLEGCIERCVSGFGDADGLRFAGAADCLDRAGPDAACGVLTACIPEAVAVDCDAFCGQLDGCRIDHPDCAAECAGGGIDVDLAGCVADTFRVGERCAGAAACVGFAPPPAGATCTRACAVQYACEPALDPYLCRLDCTPEPPALRAQLACLEVTPCAEHGVCLEVGAEVDEDCAEPCAAAVACGVFADAAECGAVCTGQLASPLTRPDYDEHLASCLADAAAGAACNRAQAEACFTPALCEGTDAVVVIPPRNGRFQYDTSAGQNRYEASCAGGARGPEVVFAFTLAAPAALTAETVNADYDTALFLRRDCDDARAEVACDDDGGAEPLHSRIQVNRLEAGTWFIFVDGFAQSRGRGELVVTIRPL